MLQPGGDLDLAQEALSPQRGCQLRTEQLDGDGAPMLQVLGEIDRRHPPAPELSLDGVTPGEGDLEECQLIGHGSVAVHDTDHHRDARPTPPERTLPHRPPRDERSDLAGGGKEGTLAGVRPPNYAPGQVFQAAANDSSNHSLDPDGIP